MDKNKLKPKKILIKEFDTRPGTERIHSRTRNFKISLSFLN